MKLTVYCAAVALLVFAILLVSVDVNNGDTETSVTRRRNNQGRRRGRVSGGRNSTRSRGNRNRHRNRGRNSTRRGGSGTSRRPDGIFPDPADLPSDCEEIHVPMCKGLVKWTHTRLPNQFNHTTQLQVYRHLEHLWSYMDHYCSKNTRVMACAMYLPRCMPSGPAQLPCRETCTAAKRKCARPFRELLGLKKWNTKFNCPALPREGCVPKVRERRCRNEYPNCVRNSHISVCANLTFTWGIMPNMFSQCSVQDVNTELTHYSSLISTNCHQDLRFMLCGVHSPYCVRNNEVPFTFPCRELCTEVRQACEPHYRRLNHNLPWPNKLQCHRFPLSNDTYYECVMPREGSIFRAN